jgi:succinylglutamate desuccinylase
MIFISITYFLILVGIILYGYRKINQFNKSLNKIKDNNFNTEVELTKQFNQAEKRILDLRTTFEESYIEIKQLLGEPNSWRDKVNSTLEQTQIKLDLLHKINEESNSTLSSKKESTNSMQVELKKEFNEYKKLYDKISNYVVVNTQKLEQRPEQVRRELKDNLQQHKEHLEYLTKEVIGLRDKINEENSTLFKYLSKLEDKMVVKHNPSRQY